MKQEPLETGGGWTVRGHGPQPGPWWSPRRSPPPSHLLSSMAVYTAWGDTEKNVSNLSSQVSSVSCGRNGSSGEANWETGDKLSRPHAQGSLWSPKPRFKCGL